jgi:phosphopantothenoylcysteine decarboxylase/phosphopantothenate--cysteine ligase
MASGLEGEGRLIEPDELLSHIRYVLGKGGTLSERRVVVTAGPTREAIDPVRFLSNRSSGRQGFALAQAAVDRGATVTLISGPAHLTPPTGARLVAVTTAHDMLEAVLTATENADVLIMAAAVSDYQPAEYASQKMKKAAQELPLSLLPTVDILSSIAERREQTGIPQVVVGFAAESESLVANARRKLKAKRLDLIVANDITSASAGFAVDTNRVTLLAQDGTAEPLPLLSKTAVSEVVLDRTVQILADRG